MKLFIGQDYFGNVYITDERDALPPDLTDFHEVLLPNKYRHKDTQDLTMEVQIEDYCESISIVRDN